MDITISYEGILGDFKVNRKQKIEDTITVISEGTLFFEGKKEKYTIFSKRRGERINRHLTYEQAEIYAGDILFVEA